MFWKGLKKKDKVILTKRVDVNIAERVEYIANNSKDIELTKSEVAHIILHAFFKSQKYKDFEKVREFTIKLGKCYCRLPVEEYTDT
jgi:hypothetical protein